MPRAHNEINPIPRPKRRLRLLLQQYNIERKFYEGVQALIVNFDSDADVERFWSAVVRTAHRVVNERSDK
jgi:hypothetical protein